MGQDVASGGFARFLPIVGWLPGYPSNIRRDSLKPKDHESEGTWSKKTELATPLHRRVSMNTSSQGSSTEPLPEWSPSLASAAATQHRG